MENDLNFTIKKLFFFIHYKFRFDNFVNQQILFNYVYSDPQGDRKLIQLKQMSEFSDVFSLKGPIKIIVCEFPSFSGYD